MYTYDSNELYVESEDERKRPVSFAFAMIEFSQEFIRTFRLYLVVTPTDKNPPLIGLAAR